MDDDDRLADKLHSAHHHHHEPRIAGGSGAIVPCCSGDAAAPAAAAGVPAVGPASPPLSSMRATVDCFRLKLGRSR